LDWSVESKVGRERFQELALQFVARTEGTPAAAVAWLKTAHAAFSRSLRVVRRFSMSCRHFLEGKMFSCQEQTVRE
jgi:hypothetical protein